MKQNLAKYKDQLPVFRRFSINSIYTFFGTTGSIVAILVLWFNKDHPLYSTVIVGYIIFFNIALLGYNIYREHQKKSRYAQSVYYTHYVLHSIRDILSDSKNNNLTKESLIDILDAISECFSIITGVRCRVSLKEMNNKKEMVTAARNSASLTSSNDASIIHKLDDNTDFINLWYSINGCSRYFLCNNIIKAWTEQEYKNSSFKNYGGTPKATNIFGQVWLRGTWKLPYRSTIVFPIRYIHDYNPPNSKSKKKNSDWHYWGFLCIDSNHRDVFDSRFLPELGASFADALYVLFNEYSKKTEGN